MLIHRTYAASGGECDPKRFKSHVVASLGVTHAILGVDDCEAELFVDELAQRLRRAVSDVGEGRAHRRPPTVERASAAASASESQLTRQRSSDQTGTRVRLARRASSRLFW